MTEDAKKKILVIDDDEGVRKLLGRLLGGADFDVIEAEDAEGGQLLATEEKPDLIILDLGLPGTRGEDLAEAFRGQDDIKDIPLIILSGEGTVNKKVELLLGGAAQFIDKPFDNVELLKAVKQYF